MTNNDTATKKRIATECPRPTRVCAICGHESTEVRRFSDMESRIPPHTACVSCQFNPLTDSREEYLEALQQ